MDCTDVMPTLRRSAGLHTWQSGPRMSPTLRRTRPQNASAHLAARTVAPFPSRAARVVLRAARVVRVHTCPTQSLRVRRNPLGTVKDRGGEGGKWYSQYSELAEADRKRFKPSFFPPPLETAKALHLERCMRFLPHFQDTGGFFVAVLHKLEAAAHGPTAAAAAAAGSSGAADILGAKRKRESGGEESGLGGDADDTAEPEGKGGKGGDGGGHPKRSRKVPSQSLRTVPIVPTRRIHTPCRRRTTCGADGVLNATCSVQL